MIDVGLATVALPDFGAPDERPVIGSDIYEARFAEFARRVADAGFDVAVVYADREHSANLSYLTGFDPRFEEALLIVSDGEPLLLTGNECVGMARAAPLDMHVELFQDFSLPGQPRDRSRPLDEILSGAGVVPGAHVGAIGWKLFDDDALLDLPAFLVDALRAGVGPSGSVRNAAAILIDADHGMRVVNEIDQLAAFEYAASHTSTAVRDLIRGIEPGMREDHAVQLLQWDGSPLSCHLMLTAGERASLGLLSPGDRRIERGDPFTTAYGVWGALNCRAGFVIADESELPAQIADYVDRLVAPYFAAIVEWYEALHVGQTGGVLADIVTKRLGDPFFGIFLNPGHQIHLDEWVNSPIFEGSSIPLRSGTALQVDVIPATGTEYFTTNIEDGIALLDETDRRTFQERHPGAWQRIVQRRTFMRDSLGIDLHPDVMPFSNIPAYLAPFLLQPDRVMVAR